jgi:cobalt-zinc-cadmium efflux system membrane fusion protein
MKHRHRTNAAPLVVAALALGCNAAATPAETPEHNRDFIRLDPGNPRLNYVKVEVVEQSNAASAIHLTGRIAFDEDHTQRVASPIDGRVARVLVQLGERVRQGQSLVELWSAHVAEIHAEAQKAEQDLTVAEKSVSRCHKLKEDGAISDKDVAQSEADYEKAKADSARTVAQLQSLNLSAKGPGIRAALRAQIPGMVVERNILVGQEVRADAAFPLLTVSDLGTAWALADVYEQDLALVTPAAAVSIRVPAYPGEFFPGKIDHVGDVLDSASHTVKLRCVVSNPGNRLKPEMFAKIELAAPPQNAVLLPSKAILTDSEHSRVIVALEGNVYRLRVVETGPEVEGKVRVIAGLTPGEKVVTEGAIFLNREMEKD